MLFLIPGGAIMKTLIHASLGMWALMNLSDLALHVLTSNRDFPILAGFKYYFELISYSKVEIVQSKAILEIVIGIISPIFVMMSQSALIFPVLYF
jgi:hypothetical protein